MSGNPNRKRQINITTKDFSIKGSYKVDENIPDKYKYFGYNIQWLTTTQKPIIWTRERSQSS